PTHTHLCPYRYPTRYGGYISFRIIPRPKQIQFPSTLSACLYPSLTLPLVAGLGLSPAEAQFILGPKPNNQALSPSAPFQGSQLTFPPRHSSFKGGIKLKLNVVKTKCAPLRMYSPQFHAARFRSSRLSYGARVRSCQVTSFKGNEENKSEDESTIAKFTKNRLQIYFSRHGDMTHRAVSYAVVAANKTASRSQAVHRLFWKWIKQHTECPNESREAIVEGPSQTELVQAQTRTHVEERSNVLMLALRYFRGLDATIKVPFLIFVPFFLAVAFMYGMEVSKELTRLWIIGPLIAAFYTRIVQKIIALYIFSIRQPAICRNVSERLKEAVLLRVTKIKSFDPKEITIRKWEEFKETLEERYIDFTEWIWPVYLIIFKYLKKAKTAWDSTEGRLQAIRLLMTEVLSLAVDRFKFKQRRRALGFTIKHQAWHWQANYLPLTINAFKVPPCLHNFHVKMQALASRFHSENQHLLLQ
ncbi:hypothetical protein AKJ16_DCAP05960, partial [Drosera capensis]